MQTLRLVAGASLLLATTLAAQTPPSSSPAPQPAPTPRLAASTQASVSAILPGRMIGGRWLPGAGGLAGPARITIEYGQPHARGRAIVGALVPFDSVWRTGANLATHLTTDVDLSIGGTLVKRGTYTLYTLPTKNGWKLIINRQTGQWGTDYDQAMDLARVDLKSRTLAEPVEALTIWLIPAADAPARGVLKLAWDRTELSADWRVVH